MEENKILQSIFSKLDVPDLPSLKEKLKAMETKHKCNTNLKFETEFYSCSCLQCKPMTYICKHCMDQEKTRPLGSANHKFRVCSGKQSSSVRRSQSGVLPQGRIVCGYKNKKKSLSEWEKDFKMDTHRRFLNKLNEEVTELLKNLLMLSNDYHIKEANLYENILTDLLESNGDLIFMVNDILKKPYLDEKLVTCSSWTFSGISYERLNKHEGVCSCSFLCELVRISSRDIANNGLIQLLMSEEYMQEEVFLAMIHNIDLIIENLNSPSLAQIEHLFSNDKIKKKIDKSEKITAEVLEKAISLIKKGDITSQIAQNLLHLVCLLITQDSFISSPTYIQVVEKCIELGVEYSKLRKSVHETDKIILSIFQIAISYLNFKELEEEVPKIYSLLFKNILELSENYKQANSNRKNITIIRMFSIFHLSLITDGEELDFSSLAIKSVEILEKNGSVDFLIIIFEIYIDYLEDLLRRLGKTGISKNAAQYLYEDSNKQLRSYDYPLIRLIFSSLTSSHYKQANKLFFKSKFDFLHWVTTVYNILFNDFALVDFCFPSSELICRIRRKFLIKANKRNPVLKDYCLNILINETVLKKKIEPHRLESIEKKTFIRYFPEILKEVKENFIIEKTYPGQYESNNFFFIKFENYEFFDWTAVSPVKCDDVSNNFTKHYINIDYANIKHKFASDGYRLRGNINLIREIALNLLNHLLEENKPEPLKKKRNQSILIKILMRFVISNPEIREDLLEASKGKMNKEKESNTSYYLLEACLNDFSNKFMKNHRKAIRSARVFRQDTCLVCNQSITKKEKGGRLCNIMWSKLSSRVIASSYEEELDRRHISITTRNQANNSENASLPANDPTVVFCMHSHCHYSCLKKQYNLVNCDKCNLEYHMIIRSNLDLEEKQCFDLQEWIKTTVTYLKTKRVNLKETSFFTESDLEALDTTVINAMTSFESDTYIKIIQMIKSTLFQAEIGVHREEFLNVCRILDSLVSETRIQMKAGNLPYETLFIKKLKMMFYWNSKYIADLFNKMLNDTIFDDFVEAAFILSVTIEDMDFKVLKYLFYYYLPLFCVQNYVAGILHRNSFNPQDLDHIRKLDFETLLNFINDKALPVNVSRALTFLRVLKFTQDYDYVLPNILAKEALSLEHAECIEHKFSLKSALEYNEYDSNWPFKKNIRELTETVISWTKSSITDSLVKRYSESIRFNPALVHSQMICTFDFKIPEVTFEELRQTIEQDENACKDRVYCALCSKIVCLDECKKAYHEYFVSHAEECNLLYCLFIFMDDKNNFVIFVDGNKCFILDENVLTKKNTHDEISINKERLITNDSLDTLKKNFLWYPGELKKNSEQ